MARVKRAVNAHKKRRSILKASRGYRGQRSRLYRKAKEQQLHSLNYAYRDRRARKGEFRKLWIARINAAARLNDITYNRLIQGLKAAGVEVTGKTSPTLRSATRRRSPRWSTSPGRHCPKTSTPPPGRPPDPDSGLRQGYAGAHRTLGQGGHGGQTASSRRPAPGGTFSRRRPQPGSGGVGARAGTGGIRHRSCGAAARALVGRARGFGSSGD